MSGLLQATDSALASLNREIEHPYERMLGSLQVSLGGQEKKKKIVCIQPETEV